MQINYPVYVQRFLAYFDLFDFDYLPQIIPAGKYTMKSPLGFQKNDVDSLLFRNGSQYILLTCIFLALYLLFKPVQIYFN